MREQNKSLELKIQEKVLGKSGEIRLSLLLLKGKTLESDENRIIK